MLEWLLFFVFTIQWNEYIVFLIETKNCIVQEG